MGRGIMLKAVVFDFDGTLADTFRIKWDAIAELLREERGIVLARSDYAQARDKDIRSLLREAKVPVFRLPFYVKGMDSMTGEKVKKARLFRGIKPLLKALSREYSLGIVSASKSEFVEACIRNNGVEPFSFMFCGGQFFGKEKLIGKMLGSRRLKREEIVYVGDEVRDVQACKKAGVRMIAVSWGFNSQRRLLQEKPDYIAGTPAELGRIIGSIRLEEMSG
jgi:phosphoglycolate phosphatase